MNSPLGTPTRTITTLGGTAARPLGLAAHPRQESACVHRAFEHGVNFFFFFGPGAKHFVQGLGPLVRKHRDDIIVASGSGARQHGSLKTARRKILAALDVEMVDVFFAEYIHPADDPERVFGHHGVLAELQGWKENGWIRFVGATAHDRKLANRLANDPRVDLLMHRFNMAHRKAAEEVFPAALKTQTPVVAFTATRWGTLLESYDGWSGQPPTAADCYRYCLSHSAVHIALSAPESTQELLENLEVLGDTTLSRVDQAHWEQFGDIVYKQGSDRFETRWP